jgi:hypothetical protein
MPGKNPKVQIGRAAGGITDIDINRFAFEAAGDLC